MPLLIARIETSQARRGSLKPLWAQISQEILAATSTPVSKVSVQVLDAREVDWLPADLQFKDGKLSLSHNNQIFAQVELCGADLVGHIAKKHLQIIDHSQTFLFRLKTQKDYINTCATLLLWSNARPAGVENKVYFPKVPEPAIKDKTILVCNIDYAPLDGEWQQTIAVLRRTGVLDIGDTGKPPLESVNIRELDSHAIRCLDYSVAGPRVLTVGKVCIRFASDADLDDWYVSLKAFTKQLVYAPLPPDSLKSIRTVRHIRLQGVTVRVSRDHPALSPRTPGSIDADDLDFSNTYLEFGFKNTLYGRTCIHMEPDIPYWSQPFQFLDVPDGPMTVNLRYTEDGIITPDAMSIGTANVEESEWLVLDNPSVPISVHVQLSTENHQVLDSSYYEDLREQALQLNAGLAYKLGNALPQDMAMLCNTFFQIYLAERKQTEWVEFLIASEIDETCQRENSLATMFRGNSMMTRGIEKYLQTIGRSVLERTVGRFVRKVLNTNDTFELDPARVQTQLISQGVGSGGPTVDKVIAANRITITNYMVFIWTLIKKEGVPEHFKWIFTFLAETMRTKLGVTNPDTVYSAVSAFLFLRFYCPALLNPLLFNLVDEAVSPANHRALTLVAKLLQGFANRVRFGSKEPWLMHMNSFLDKYEHDLTDWYDALTSYSGERPRERDAKEAPLAVYMDNQPSNPYLIDEWASFSRLVKWGAQVSFDKSWDTVVTRFFSSCKRVDNDLKDVLEELAKPDSLASVENGLDLHVDWDQCLFSNNAKLLENDKVVRPEKKRVWSKLIGR